MKIAIAGASGFVGQALIRGLLKDPQNPGVVPSNLVGLSRSVRAPKEGDIEWRKADLLDDTATSRGLQGCDVAYYLVHAMLPSARLNQGSFADFDLLQADNFARASARAGVKEIIYLSGLIPTDLTSEELSEHLRSRLEVERVLGTYGVRVTTLRAGLVIGPGGSSSEIMIRLVKRLPVMIAPRWTMSETEPVDLGDAVNALVGVLHRPELLGQAWDLGNGERLSYIELLHRTADALGKRRPILAVNFFTPSLSRLWVSLVTGAPRNLVDPLVQSLAHSMLPREDHRILERLNIQPRALAESLREAVTQPARPHAYDGRLARADRKKVWSVQRLSAKRMIWSRRQRRSIAEFYFFWMPRFLFGIISVQKIETPTLREIRFRLPGKVDLLVLRSWDSDRGPNRVESYQVSGGWLNTPNTNGKLEFRYIPSIACILASVQGFQPRLPWFIYRFTQALIHLWVMRRFERAL